MSERRNTGIYVDVDNYMIPLDGRPDNVREGLRFIFERAEEEGEVVEARAYANYAKQPFWLLRMLCAHSISMIFTPPLNGDGKNIDDQEMAKDITLAPYMRSEINTIVVVSADGHFVPAIGSARRCGRKVIVMCTGRPNSVLRETASEVVIISCNGQDAGSSEADDVTEDLDSLLGDIEALIRERGAAFHRRSLIEALVVMNDGIYNRDRVEAMVDQLVERDALRFSISNSGKGSSYALQINKAAWKHEPDAMHSAKSSQSASL